MKGVWDPVSFLGLVLDNDTAIMTVKIPRLPFRISDSTKNCAQITSAEGTVIYAQFFTHSS